MEDNSWLSKVSTLIGAKDTCSQRALDGLSVPDSLSDSQKLDMAAEHACISALNNPKIKKLLDASTYLAFEKKLKSFEAALLEKGRGWLDECDSDGDLGLHGQKLELLSCINQKWEHKASEVFDQWAGQDQNKDFKNQKSLFLMRAANNSLRIKRGIASQDLED